MFDDNDSESGIGVAIALAVAIFAALFAIGMAAGTSLGIFAGGKPAAVPGTAASVAAPVAAPAAGPMTAPAAATAAPTAAVTEARLYFELAKHELPADALTKVAPLVAALKLNDNARLLISGYHDASGNAVANAELAKQRAFAVRDLLMTAGVPADRIDMLKPLVTTGGADPHEARRVDVTLR